MKLEPKRNIIPLPVYSFSLIIITFLVFRTNLPKIPTILLYNFIIIASIQGLDRNKGMMFFSGIIMLTFLISLGEDLNYLWNLPLFFITFFIVRSEIKKQTYAANLLQVCIERLEKDTNLILDKYRIHKKEADSLERAHKSR